MSNGESAGVDAATREELSTAGLLTADGEIHPLVADLALAMSRPLIELFVESASDRGQVTAHVVVGGDETIWYTDPWPGRDETVYTRDALPQLIWVLARLVGFRRSTPPPVSRPVAASFSTVGSLMAAFAAASEHTEWEDVRTVAIATLDDILGSMETDQREMWLAVLATLQATWRVTCVWGPDSRAHARGLAVWDCGPGGFWVRTTPAEPLHPEDIAADPDATFVPTSGGDLWQALSDLLPAKGELEAGAAASGALV
ncbi:hypothetical protein D9V37_17165 [Nocardioides mangrovicus]|uniref:Uncharacterized protein n=1 Tax=Nocardioides mangrovicus TaxID=2478913 RepID=A0A3L8NZW4_9ACTN|nr:hypothetical protein D9V37_17165 [Nocardioides mangrovicus]